MARRVITGRTGADRAVVTQDDELPELTLALFPGCTFSPIWGTDVVPPVPGAAELPRTWFTSPCGIRIALTSRDPSARPVGSDIDMEMARREVVAKLPDLLPLVDPDASEKHRTDSIDIVFVLEGEVVLELDDGAQTTLSAGDVAIQQGAAHAWHPQPGSPLRLFSVMIGAGSSQSG